MGAACDPSSGSGWGGGVCSSWGGGICSGGSGSEGGDCWLDAREGGEKPGPPGGAVLLDVRSIPWVGHLQWEEVEESISVAIRATGCGSSAGGVNTVSRGGGDLWTGSAVSAAAPLYQAG
ncbi:hypothetical protein PLESTM_000030300 [Pleodorina starrii]|nr:hypothetical protein PLESTM_000030300 [Pleodorina starrii]